jgi:hypothetical protein
MSDKKKVLIFLILFFKLIFICNSSETKKYTYLEMLYEDPLVFESWTFTLEYYKNSSYIDNDKEICYFLSSNWKYENHNVFIEYIFATKNYKTLKINLYKIIIKHDDTLTKSYNHDIEGAWEVLLFEKMEPKSKLLADDKKFGQFNKMVDKWITKGDKYKILKINDISFFEKINQIQGSNAYICTALLTLKNNNDENNDIISEEFLFEEEISSGDISIRHVIYRNPNI